MVVGFARFSELSSDQDFTFCAHDAEHALRGFREELFVSAILMFLQFCVGYCFWRAFYSHDVAKRCRRRERRLAVRCSRAPARPSHDACSVETEKGKGNWCPIPGGLAFGVCFDLRVLLINATELEKINMVVCLYLGI